MDRLARIKRRKSIRAKITGTKERPRLNVFRSSRYIYAALVDDTVGKTLISTGEKDINKSEKKTKKEKAFLVGKKIAEKAAKEGISKVVFDRAGYLFHGRLKELAAGAKEGGLKF
ncbi:MAG: 50S ribosomal protein L18 [Candidatus Woykebacteria bacterium]